MDDDTDYSEYDSNEGLSHRLLPNHSTYSNIRIFLKKNRSRIYPVVSVAIIVSILLTILILVVRTRSKQNDHSPPSSTKISTSLTDLNEPKYILEKQDSTPNGVNWGQLVNQLANQLYDLYNWNDYQSIDLFNKTCMSQVKGRFHRLKWMWDGRIECDGIVGRSTEYAGRETAVKKALEDYLTKYAQSHSIPSLPSQ